jgi:hypothetical protein
MEHGSRVLQSAGTVGSCSCGRLSWAPESGSRGSTRLMGIDAVCQVLKVQIGGGSGAQGRTKRATILRNVAKLYDTRPEVCTPYVKTLLLRRGIPVRTFH